jgi:hypothetical protein
MADSHSDFATAERLSRRRARVIPVLAVLLISQQATFLTDTTALDAARNVDVVRLSAWVVLSLVLLFALWTGGSWLQRKAVRELLNDEVTRAHRGDALSLGFLCAMLAAIGIYVLSMAEPIHVREALHLVVSTGIAVALLRFGFLERRAHRVG